MLKRRISVKERLELGDHYVVRDTLLSEERLKERSARVPKVGRLRVNTGVRSLNDGERLLNEFRSDCLQELMLDDHPKAQDAFDLAMRLANDDLGQAFERLKEISALMVPRDPITGWQEVSWHVQRAADACEGRRARHACIKFVINTLVDMLQEPDDE